MKLKEILASYDALQALSREKINLDVSFDISKILTILGTEKRTYDELIYKKLNEYGDSVKDEKGQPIVYANNAIQYKIRPENIEKYQKELNELQEKDIKIKINKIKLSSLGIDKIEPELLTSLIWLIEK